MEIGFFLICLGFFIWSMTFAKHWQDSDHTREMREMREFGERFKERDERLKTPDKK